jgi:glycosyltransferase involved in cell wall biosynthesis
MFARTVLQAGEWASARCPSATVVVSNTLRDHYVDKQGFEPIVVQNAVLKGRVRPLRRLRQAGLRKDDFILFAGRLSPEKGVETLLEAFGSLGSPKQLVLAGGTSYSEKYIDDLRHKAGSDVVFLGRVDRESMEELLSNCYVFVLPSTMEGLSIALLEAISYGNCVVTTSIPENMEAIGDAGPVFPVGDVQALRSILDDLLQQPDLVEEYRLKARLRAQDLPDWDDVARLTEDFYLRLLEGRI